jgi:selenocysteine lyase/cysteine desulfurase
MQADSIDVFAGACHKWLLTPEGIGYLVLSERACTLIEPTLIGWISVENPEDYGNFEQNFKPGALAWETGTFVSSLFYALEANLKLLHEIGVDKINAYLLELTDFLCEKVASTNYRITSSRKAEEKSSIVCLESKQGFSTNEIYKHLLKQKIVVAKRGDCLRISPHLYNNFADIEKLVAALP